MPVDDETFSQLRAAVERFVDTRLRPAEAQVEEEDAVPDAIVEEMKGHLEGMRAGW